jgi:hypothetical protein
MFDPAWACGGKQGHPTGGAPTTNRRLADRRPVMRLIRARNRRALADARPSRAWADTSAVERDPALDDAIETATDRTRTAQADFEDAIEPDEAPRPATADRVVRRAEDLHDLTAQAVDDGVARSPTPEPPPDERQKRHLR